MADPEAFAAPADFGDFVAFAAFADFADRVDLADVLGWVAFAGAFAFTAPARTGAAALRDRAETFLPVAGAAAGLVDLLPAADFLEAGFLVAGVLAAAVLGAAFLVAPDFPVAACRVAASDRLPAADRDEALDFAVLLRRVVLTGYRLV